MGSPGHFHGEASTPVDIFQWGGPADRQCSHRRTVGGPATGGDSPVAWKAFSTVSLSHPATHAKTPDRQIYVL